MSQTDERQPRDVDAISDRLSVYQIEGCDARRGLLLREEQTKRKNRKDKTKKRKQERNTGVKVENKKIERADMIRIVMNWDEFCLASLKRSTGLNHSDSP